MSFGDRIQSATTVPQLTEPASHQIMCVVGFRTPVIMVNISTLRWHISSAAVALPKDELVTTYVPHFECRRSGSTEPDQRTPSRTVFSRNRDLCPGRDCSIHFGCSRAVACSSTRPDLSLALTERILAVRVNQARVLDHLPRGGRGILETRGRACQTAVFADCVPVQ
jgi:hypothetical protein